MSNIFRIFKRHKHKFKVISRTPWDCPVIVDCLTNADIEKNKKFVQKMRNHKWNTPPSSFMFFSLYSLDFLAGGYKTHMDLVAHIYRRLGAKIYMCFIPDVVTDKQMHEFYQKLEQFYPDVKIEIVSVAKAHTIQTDVCISLGIATAEAIKYDKCQEKYLHAMDYESLFFSSGTDTTILDFIYSQGFFVFTNSLALRDIYSRMNPNTPVFRYVPGIDKIYYPPEQKHNEKCRLIAYARPSIPRNAFTLLTPVFQELKKQFSDKIEILLVGQNFDVRQYELDGVCTNLGKLNSLNDLADLYRTCDIGFSFITTPTFSYMHLQLMASGLCLVTNDQSGIRNFLHDNENAIVVPPVPNIIAQRVADVINNPKKMQAIAQKGYETVRNFNWDSCFDSIIDFIVKPKG